jgi:hypothetical protein
MVLLAFRMAFRPFSEGLSGYQEYFFGYLRRMEIIATPNNTNG